MRIYSLKKPLFCYKVFLQLSVKELNFLFMLKSVCYRDAGDEVVTHQEPRHHFHSTADLIHYAPEGAAKVEGVDAGFPFTITLETQGKIKRTGAIH